jgi:hypothetical protein
MRHAHHAHHAHHDCRDCREWAVAHAGVGLGVAAIEHATQPKPPPEPEPVAYVPVTKPPFDSAAARKALADVPYEHCGEGGEAQVQIRFTGDGVAQEVKLHSRYSPKVAKCVRKAFESVRVPPFWAKEHAVAWKIRLPDSTPPEGAQEM